MKATQVVVQAAVALLSLSSTGSAWSSWPKWLPERDALIARQDQSSSSTTSQSSSSSFQDIQTNLNTGGLTSSPPASGTASVAPSGGASGASGASGSGGSQTTTTMAPTPTSFNPEDPPGGVQMITPATTTTALYRIGEFVTWGWNYTSLQATPTAVDLLVSCATASETWTLTSNMTFATPGSYTWDTGAFQSSAIATPLLTEMYTMILYDADSNPTAPAEAGYLAAYSGFTFGLYAGQSYTPLASGWVCATCNSANSDMDKRVLGVAVFTSILTVLSFTWFVAGFGALL